MTHFLLTFYVFRLSDFIALCNKSVPSRFLSSPPGAHRPHLFLVCPECFIAFHPLCTSGAVLPIPASIFLMHRYPVALSTSNKATDIDQLLITMACLPNFAHPCNLFFQYRSTSRRFNRLPSPCSLHPL